MSNLGDNMTAHLTSESEVVFSFDTTGSMYPCLGAVRRDVNKTCRDLFGMFPSVRIGVISHGDYCDGQLRINHLEITSDQQQIERFIRTTPPTGGGDAPECYELALFTARGLNWKTLGGRMLVLIGDDEPHPPDYHMNLMKLDWREQLAELKRLSVRVFGVQCLYSPHRPKVNAFWEELAELAGTKLFRFDQGQEFSQYAAPAITGMVAASQGAEAFDHYSRSAFGMANNAKLSAHVVSGMMCAARSFDDDPKG